MLAVMRSSDRPPTYPPLRAGRLRDGRSSIATKASGRARSSLDSAHIVRSCGWRGVAAHLDLQRDDAVAQREDDVHLGAAVRAPEVRSHRLARQPECAERLLDAPALEGRPR